MSFRPKLRNALNIKASSDRPPTAPRVFEPDALYARHSARYHLTFNTNCSLPPQRSCFGEDLLMPHSAIDPYSSAHHIMNIEIDANAHQQFVVVQHSWRLPSSKSLGAPLCSTLPTYFKLDTGCSLVFPFLGSSLEQPEPRLASL